MATIKTAAYLSTIIGFSSFSLYQFEVYFHQPTNLEDNSELRNYLQAFAIFTLYLVVVAILVTQKLINHKLNGILTLLVCLLIYFLLEICGFHVRQYIITHIFYLSIAAFSIANALHLYVYIRGLYIPNSSIHWLDSLYLGRESRPLIFGKLDLKVYVNRLAVLTTILLDATFAWESFPNHKTFLIMIAVRSIYMIDGLLLEYVFETSMEIQSVGFGYPSAVTYIIFPFLVTVGTHHVYFERVEFEEWRLVTMVVFMVVGYTIFRVSNDQMYAFRKNPLKSDGVIATDIKGKKLLCGGLWGFLRHPNYLGDILIQLSLSCFKLSIPALLWYMDIIFLIQRAIENNEYCQKKYGKAWDRYCKRVKYVLVPGIY